MSLEVSVPRYLIHDHSTPDKSVATGPTSLSLMTFFYIRTGGTKVPSEESRYNSFNNKKKFVLSTEKLDCEDKEKHTRQRKKIFFTILIQKRGIIYYFFIFE